jgi:hypothetical protein
VEPRLQRRYAVLVQQHLHAAGHANPGPAAPPGPLSAFAATQAAWRFLANDHISLPSLVEPLHRLAQQWRRTAPTAWALVLHDWSALSYPTHTRKADCHTLGPACSRGYELTTRLLVDGRQGDPVAPLEFHLRTATTLLSTRQPAPSAADSRLDDLLPAMTALTSLGLGESVVHLIDREADSLAHYRAWHTAGHGFLVRGNAGRQARWQQREQSLAAIGEQLRRAGQFQRSREVTYRGHRAVQEVAQTTVVLDRPAWRQRCRDGRRVCNQRVAGPALPLRLVVSRVCNERHETLAMWYLLTNLPASVPAETAALWYYWRWRIESFFKLLKSAGQEVEQWQQESGEAIAKRLLVAAMACAVVWQVERADGPEAQSFRALLIRLSGRQMKRGKPHTAPALLAGLWVYVAMLETLGQHSVEELQAMRKHLRLGKPDTS